VATKYLNKLLNTFLRLSNKMYFEQLQASQTKHFDIEHNVFNFKI